MAACQCVDPAMLTGRGHAERGDAGVAGRLQLPHRAGLRHRGAPRAQLPQGRPQRPGQPPPGGTHSLRNIRSSRLQHGHCARMFISVDGEALAAGEPINYYARLILCGASNFSRSTCLATTFEPDQDLNHAGRSADYNLHVPQTHVCQRAAERVLPCRTNCGIRLPAAQCSSGCTSSRSPSSRRTSSTSTTRTRWGTTAARNAACPRGLTGSSSAARSSPAALRIWAPRRCAACLRDRCGHGTA